MLRRGRGGLADGFQGPATRQGHRRTVNACGEKIENRTCYRRTCPKAAIDIHFRSSFEVFFCNRLFGVATCAVRGVLSGGRLLAGRDDRCVGRCRCLPRCWTRGRLHLHRCRRGRPRDEPAVPTRSVTPLRRKLCARTSGLKLAEQWLLTATIPRYYRPS